MLLLVTGFVPAAAAETNAFDEQSARNVIGTALAFMAPRILDPVAVPQLTLWGLRGLAAIDPRLVAEWRADRLVLRQSDQILLGVVPPASDDVQGWANTAATLAAAAWAASPTVQRGGGQAIISSFFDELFNHLDPYSRYVPPKEAEADRIRRSGEAGIGVSVVVRSGAILVSGVIADGPADLASIKVGDRIVSIDGASPHWPDAAAAAASLSGPEGTSVSVGIRDRNGRNRIVAIERALVPPETVYAEHVADMLVLRISSFNRSTDERLSHELALGLAPARHPRGLVLDLRGNRGGLLRQAVASVSLLLASGLVATTAGRDPDANQDFRVAGRDMSEGLPLVVIVDGRSASAAEVVAAALADDGRAVVIGSTTLGKGLVQAITPLPDGGELLITWSRILAPLGWPLQGLGVLPQVCTSLGTEELDHQLASLVRGRALLAQALALHRRARAPMPVSQMLDIRNACPAALGRETDLKSAEFLIHNPAAYRAALLELP